MIKSAFALTREQLVSMSVNSDYIGTLEKLSGDMTEEKLYGTLRQTKDGFIYVDVPDGIIEPFRKMIREEGIERPPTKNNVNAHITVCMDEEANEHKIKITEPKEIAFTIKGFYSVKPDGWKKVKKCWFLVVESPDIENLRKSWGLTKKDRGHAPHITTAVKYK